MGLSAAFFLFAIVTAIRANMTTVYLSDLCPRRPGGKVYLSLGAVTESFNSTAVIAAAPVGKSDKRFGYDYDMNCKLEVSAQPGQSILGSVRKTDLRDRCADNLTISAGGQKQIFCGERYDKYETDTITANGSMTIEFTSGSYSRGIIYDDSTGFEITVTAYRDAPCNNTVEFNCENSRCIAAELNCSGHNHCGDNSNQQCDTVTDTPDTCGPHRLLCANGNCVSNRLICDGSDDCGDFSDEEQCSNCSRGEFSCRNGKCVNSRSVCDKINDCDDWSDENNCSYTCMSGVEFSCANGRCIRSWRRCNGENTCGDWSDEKDCKYTCRPRQFTCENGNCIYDLFRCNKENDCGDWSDEENCVYTCSPWDFTCTNGSCIDRRQRCNKHNDCGDWSDEEDCLYTCSSLDFTCANGNCIYRWQRCNQRNDCGDWSDEENCNCSSSFETTCKNGHCIYYWKRCDGNDDCGDGSDEENCPLSVTWIIGITLGVMTFVTICVLVPYVINKRKAKQNQSTSLSLGTLPVSSELANCNRL